MGIEATLRRSMNGQRSISTCNSLRRFHTISPWTWCAPKQSTKDYRDIEQLQNIPPVDAPECEILDFSDLIDGYRQYAGPANRAGKRIVSLECGAVLHEAFYQTLPELLWHVKRAVAGSVNQFVFHGFPYSGSVSN